MLRFVACLMGLAIICACLYFGLWYLMIGGMVAFINELKADETKAGPLVLSALRAIAGPLVAATGSFSGILIMLLGLAGQKSSTRHDYSR